MEEGSILSYNFYYSEDRVRSSSPSLDIVPLLLAHEIHTVRLYVVLTRFTADDKIVVLAFRDRVD